MKTYLLFLIGAGLSTAALFGQTTPITIATGTTMTSSATITLGPVVYYITVAPLPFQPQPPFTFTRGTHLQIVAPTDGIPNPVVTWFKNNQRLSTTGSTLDIPSAVAADTGSYSAEVHSQDNRISGPTLEAAQVLVTNAGQRLTNLSTRARIDINQPFFLTGFVVEAGPKQTMVLVRAVGPTLTSLGITDALAAPQLRLTDTTGHEYTPMPDGPVSSLPDLSLTTDTAAARVGAFPLPAGSKDIAQLYLLSPGAYTAHVSSANGGTGTTLVEVYEVPL